MDDPDYLSSCGWENELNNCCSYWINFHFEKDFDYHCITIVVVVVMCWYINVCTNTLTVDDVTFIMMISIHIRRRSQHCFSGIENRLNIRTVSMLISSYKIDELIIVGILKYY